ncbi:MAG: hypothetical protein BWY72_02200 [Bacteroidetes bacterium ADurb.Bin416]|nr:MAG: hypothetical protein BWY72_02200 [Bacteroidetes bacterium ADurb.Bin416]
MNRQVFVWNDFIDVHHIDNPQSLTAGTHALGCIKRKVVGRRLAVRQSCRGAHQVPAKITRLQKDGVLLRDGILFEDHNDAVALVHGQAEAVLEAFGIFFRNFQLINHHFDVVILVAIQAQPGKDFTQLSVHPNVEKALFAQGLKQFLVMPFTRADHRGQQKNALTFVILQDQVEDLLLGVPYHLLPCGV